MVVTVPHDVEAEADLLGAMMLSRGGLRAGVARVTAADLYVPKHALIFGALAALFHRGAGVDVTTVAAELGDERLTKVGGRSELARVVASTPASANAPHYADIVAKHATCRRALHFAEDLTRYAYEGDLETVFAFAREAAEHLIPAASDVEPAVEASALAATDYTYRWLIEGLLERGDRVVVVGREGGGKSLLLRQMAVMLASGIHPFTWASCARCKVLIVDLENSEAQVSRSLRDLLKVAGERYAGTLWVRCRPQGMDLTRPGDVRWLDSLVGHHKPDVVVFGSLYKAYRGADGRSKSSEEAAELVASAIDEIRVRHDCVWLIEAHAPHGDGSDRAGWRPAGSSLWLRWPEMGFGMKVVPHGVELIHWRGARDRNRRWPTALVEGHTWPWETRAPDTYYDEPAA